MKKSTLILGCAAILLVGLAPVASATLLMSDSVIAAKESEEKHPDEITAGLLVPRRLTYADICVYYSNTTNRGDKGRIEAKVTIVDRSGDPDKNEVLFLKGQVKNNEAVICKKAPTLRPNDAVTFEIVFSDMPRLRNNGTKTQTANVAAVISEGLKPEDMIPEPEQLPAPAPDCGTTSVAAASEAAARGGTLLTSNSVLRARQKIEKHPDQMIAGLLAPRRLANADICVHYANTIRKGNKGRISTKVAILDRSGDPEKTQYLTLNGRVKNNEAILCKKAPALQPGDAVTFEADFSQMPRLRRSGARRERAHFAAVISQGIQPQDLTPDPLPAPDPEPCPEPPPPDPDPDPTPDPNPDPPPPPPPPPPTPTPTPTPSNVLSAADQVAVSDMMIGTKKVQLWRFKSDQPWKWWVIGPKTIVNTAFRGNVDPKTTGYGQTIAAAVADYVRKRGPFGKGPALSGIQVKLLEWYSGINASGGPTSLRRTGTGDYVGEYYRPGRGSVIGPHYHTMEAALQYLQRQGL